MTDRHNVAAPATAQPAPAPADTVEAYGLTCGGLEPLIAQRLRALAPGEVLEIRSDQPEAAGGIDAWVSLTGHSLVAVEHDDPRHVRYYVKKKGIGAGRSTSAQDPATTLRAGENMATTIMTNCTCGKEDPERATLPFIVGNVAASADQPAIVLLTIEGVWLATKGYADGIQKEGFQPLKDVMDSFLANGGEIWACGACAKPRGITEEHLISGARIVTAAMVVEAMSKGASTLGF